MSHGILIRNEDDDIVLDDQNSVVIVHEQGSTTSQTVSSDPGLADYGGKWYGGSTPENAGTQRRNWSTRIHLTNEYENPPIVAVRCGYNVKLPIIEVFSATGSGAPTNSGYYNAIRFRHENATTVQYIVCADAASAPSSAKGLNSETYGIQIKDDSSPQQDIFDSRWATIVAATGLYDYPTISSSSGMFTFTTNIVNGDHIMAPTVATNNISSQTIVNTPGAFIAPTLSGFIGFENIDWDPTDYNTNPENLVGGGYFGPTVVQTNGTTIAHTALRRLVGSIDDIGTVGDIYTGSYASLKGSYLVLRYLNFT